MATINDYIKEISEAQAKEWKLDGFDMTTAPTFHIEEGKRFYKVVRACFGQTQTSVHCFVEKTSGDIYKAATWSAPAKNVRGNINSEKKPLLGYQFYNKYY